MPEGALANIHALRTLALDPKQQPIDGLAAELAHMPSRLDRLELAYLCEEDAQLSAWARVASHVTHLSWVGMGARVPFTSAINAQRYACM